MRSGWLLVAAPLLLTGCASCHDPVPPGFQPLAAHFSGLDQATWELSWRDPERGITERGTLTLGPGRSGSLVAPDRDITVTWEDERMQAALKDGTVPVPSLVPYADDVRDSLRKGFSDSRWSAIDRPPLGPDVQGRRWSTIHLPHDWARELRVWLAVDDSGTFTHMVIEDRTPPLEAEVVILGGRRQVVTLSESGKLLVTIEESRWGG